MMKIRSLFVGLFLILLMGTGAHAAAAVAPDTIHIGAGSIDDGMHLYIEVGVKQDQVAFGLWMTAYPDENSGNSVMCNDTEITDHAYWQLVATEQNDPIYTDKPTYYLKDVASGKYFGTKTTTTSINRDDKRMVDGTDKAYAFCFLTAAEIKAKEGIDIRDYGNAKGVFIQHSNADGTWFRLCRYGTNTQVYYMSSSYYANNVNWQTWRLYTTDKPNAETAAKGIAALKTYYESLLYNYEIMMSSTYDDIALDKDALKTLMEEVRMTLETLPSGQDSYYTDMKQRLETQYNKAPFVDSYLRWWPITIDSLKDGSTLMMECGPNTNRYIRAYPGTSGQNAVMCNDLDKNKADIWQLVATGEHDAIYTDKPTYYLKDVTSGKYFGTSAELTSIDPNQKLMVEGTAKAYAFCILTAADINAKEKRNMNVYGNPDAVFFHHSNTDGTWFRLSRFGTHEYVDYISSSNYSTNNDWQS